VRVGLNLNGGIRAKMGRLARHLGYTITYLFEELVERAERRVAAKLSGKALEAYLDGNWMHLITNKHGYAITRTSMCTNERAPTAQPALPG
jgi:hypothetical protein